MTGLTGLSRLTGLTGRAAVAIRRRLGRRRDSGSATVFVIGFAVVLFAAAGLAVDGGKFLNAKDRAYDVAEQAARAGANRIALGPLRDQGVVVLDQGAASSAAASFVGANSAYSLDGYPGTTATTVTVRVKATVQTTILGIVGINDFTLNASATASPVTGINAGAPP